MQYGDYLYGNELLILPHTSKDIKSSGRISIEVYRPNRYLIDATKPDKEIFYWFRWTIGHHISFISWLLIDKYLNDSTNLILIDKNKAWANITRCFSLLKLLSCMYIYSSTVPQDIYNTTIRKFMKLYHSAFSATWAKDYINLKNTISNYSLQDNQELFPKKIKSIFDATKTVHIAIAGKLVKNRKSLLQHFYKNTSVQIIKDTDKIYDCFFIVQRTNCVTESTLIHSLMKRLLIIKNDVVRNGVFEPEDTDIGILLKSKITKKYIDNFELIIDENINFFS